MRKTLFVGSFVCMALWSCTKHSTNSCPDAPNGNCLAADAGDAGGIDTPLPIDAFHCTSDTQCSGVTPACELDNGTCYACTGSDIGTCAGTTPVCGSDNACQACTAHSQCPQDVCLSTGACDDGSDVAYIQGSGGSASPGSGSACTFDAPCGSFADALATGRPIIKVAGTVDEKVKIDGQTVTIYADPGANLTSMNNGTLLEIDDASTVAIYGLEITGASGAGNPGLLLATGNTSTVTLTGVGIDHNVGGGVSQLAGTLTVTQSTISSNTGAGVSTTGGTLTVTQSTISSNTGAGVSTTGGTLTVTQSTIKGNTGGGLSISAGQFDIENNFITGNGGTNGGDTVGGVYFASVSTTGNTFAFNTVTANSTLGAPSGAYCDAVSDALVLDSDIIYGNNNGTGAQFGSGFTGVASCSAIYSDIGGLGSAAGSNSFDADPMFKGTMTGDYHLLAGSPCIGAADPSTSITVDFDGDARPQAGKWDTGADEYTGSGG